MAVTNSIVTFSALTDFAVQRNFRQGTIIRFLDASGEVSEWKWDATSSTTVDSIAGGPGMVANGPGGSGRYHRQTNLVRPEYWGAVTGDGTTDSLAIAAADSYAETHNKVVTFSSGTYTIGTSISKRPNSKWVGATDNGTVLAITSGFASSHITTLSSRSDTAFERITFDGSARVAGDTNAITIFTLVTRMRVSHCRFIGLNNAGGTNFGVGIGMAKPTDVTIDNCYFTGCLDGIISNTGGEIVRMKINDCMFDGIINNGFRLTPTAAGSRDIEITGNTYRGGTGDQSAFYLTAGDIATYEMYNVKITNNTAEGSDLAFSAGGNADLFSIKDCRELIVANNYARNGGDLGYALERCNGITFTGNIGERNNSCGTVFVECVNASVTGNTMLNNVLDRADDLIQEVRPYGGIRLEGATLAESCLRFAITGNTCTDNQVTKTQNWGIVILVNDPAVVHSDLVITGNSLEGNLFGPAWNDIADQAFTNLHYPSAPMHGKLALGDSFIVNSVRSVVTTAGALFTDEWTATTAVNIGQRLATADNVYFVRVAGTTGGSAPTATGAGNVADGSATIYWQGPRIAYGTDGALSSLDEFAVDRNLPQGTIIRLIEASGEVSEWKWDATATDTVNSTANGAGTIANGPGGTGRYLRQYKGHTLASWFGAAPSATAAVNHTALTAALAASENVHIAQIGTYDIDGAAFVPQQDSELSCVKGVVIRSTNPDASTNMFSLTANGSTLRNLVIDQSAGLLGKVTGYTLVNITGTDCKLIGCEIFAGARNGLTTDPGLLPVLVNAGADRLLIEDCIVRDSDVTYGIQLNGGQEDVVINRTKILGNAADGLKLTGTGLVAGLQVTNCFVENNGYGLSSGGAPEQEDGMDINCPVRGITITSTRFANNAGSGAICKETGSVNIGSLSYVNCVMANNRIHGSMVFGPTGVRNVLYTGCTFAENGSAVVTFDFTGGTSEDLWTSPLHGFENDDRVTLKTNGTIPGGYDTTTSYFVVNATTNTFQLSLTSGGAVVEGTTDGVGRQHARDSASADGAGMHLSGANIGINNCLFRRNYDSGLYVSGGVNVTGSDLQFHGNGHALGANSRNITVANNAANVQLHNCISMGIDPFGDDVDPAGYAAATIYTQKVILVTSGSTNIKLDVDQRYHSSSEKFASTAGSEVTINGTNTFDTTAADLTPNIYRRKHVRTSGNGDAITDLDYGGWAILPGHEIVLEVLPGDSLVHATGKFKLSGGVDFAPASGGTITLMYVASTGWVQHGAALSF